MVIKNRSSSVPHIGSQENRQSSQIPYGDGLLDKKTYDRSNDQKLQGIRFQSPVFMEENRTHNGFSKAESRNKTRSLGLETIIKILLAAAGIYYISFLRTEVAKREKGLTAIRHDFDLLENELIINEAKIQKTVTSQASLQSQLTSLLSDGHRNKLTNEEESNTEMIYEKVVERQGSMVHRINDLQSNIAHLHRSEALEHFGSQPYKVQFNIQIEENIFSFAVEMAGLELMPHSVHYFMQMVKAKVWDNTVFRHRSNHILYAQLMDDLGNDKRYLLSEKDINPNLSFPEYTDEYPHHKYTLGFSGRPGGPEFYINTDDNAETHGPGGQTVHALQEEADPCFGTVIDGHQVIDWLQARTTAALGGGQDKAFTVIKSVRIIQ